MWRKNFIQIGNHTVRFSHFPPMAFKSLAVHQRLQLDAVPSIVNPPAHPQRRQTTSSHGPKKHQASPFPSPLESPPRLMPLASTIQCLWNQHHLYVLHHLQCIPVQGRALIHQTHWGRRASSQIRCKWSDPSHAALHPPTCHQWFSQPAALLPIPGAWGGKSIGLQKG